MVKRKRVSRRRTGRKRRRSGGVSTFRRRMLRRMNRTMYLKRTYYAGAWTFATTTTNDFWRYNTFTTSSINNFTELAAVFDEYKICAIKQTWRPRYDSIDAANATAAPEAYAHVIIDPESNITPTGTYSAATENAFLENGDRVKTFKCNRPFSVYFKPKISVQTAASVTYQRSKFLPVADTTDIHRGYHMFLHVNNLTTSSTNFVLDSFVTVYLKLRGRK